MKFILLALMLMFGATASAEIHTYYFSSEKEANENLQKVTDAINNKEHEEISVAEWHRESIKSLGPVEQQRFYRGSGSRVSDKDVYIDGKKHHCTEYEYETQCHID